MERKHTPLGKTYWNGEGAYSKENKRLSKLLVEGSKTHIPTNVHGRLLSAVNMLVYEYNNNGNGNIIETIDIDCPECHGSGYEEVRHRGGDDEDEYEERDCSCCGGNCTILDELEIREDYKEELDFVIKTLPKEDKHLAIAVENFLLDKNIYLSRQHNRRNFEYFSDENEAIYDRMADAVMYFVLTTENKELE